MTDELNDALTTARAKALEANSLLRSFHSVINVNAVTWTNWLALKTRLATMLEDQRVYINSFDGYKSKG